MKIEVLYFEGCPNHEPAVARVDEIVKAEGISAEVSEVNVPDTSTAHEVGFLGSPSIRVNGMDVEQPARCLRRTGPAASCCGLRPLWSFCLQHFRTTRAL